MNDHMLNPETEVATRVFLTVMRRAAHQRHPQRVENPVPLFEALGPRDRAIMLTAIGTALDAAKAHRKKSAEEQPVMKGRDTESVPTRLAS